MSLDTIRNETLQEQYTGEGKTGGKVATDKYGRLLQSPHRSAENDYGADYVSMTWTGTFPNVFTYKTGGSGGTVIATVTYGNDGTNITSKTVVFS